MNISELHEIYKSSNGVSTDTRQDIKGKIFFALKGDNFDGNKYATLAIEKGAIYSIVDDPVLQGDQYINVENTLDTLQKLASFHRSTLSTKIFGITGSNGKTTNKELLSAVLSKKLVTYATKGNLNNHIGVPLSLLNIKPNVELAIIEMGANQMGDIEELCEIANPDFGYITNIGKAHLEGFGSVDNIKHEKGALFRHVINREGTLFANRSEKEVQEIAGNYKDTIYIGNFDEESNYRFKFQSVIPKVVLKEEDGYTYDSNLYGVHNYQNIKMAIGVGLYFGVPRDAIKEAIANYIPDNNRSQVESFGDTHLYLDAYNANPSSMSASIRSFAQIESERKIIIIGDMLELGNDEIKYHQEIIALLDSYTWTEVYLLGPLFSKANETMDNSYTTFETKALFDQNVDPNKLTGCNILIKGSRGMQLENLEFIRQLRKN